MLDEVMWCVSDAPDQARLDTMHTSATSASEHSGYAYQ